MKLKLILSLIVISCLTVGFIYFGRYYYLKGEKAAVEACIAEKQKTVSDNIETRKKQDKVIRPSNRTYYDLLFGGKF